MQYQPLSYSFREESVRMALHEVKLCLLGESGVGKTCIVNRFVSDLFSEHESLTVGAAFTTKTVRVDDNSILFQIWDTAGQEKYRGLAPMYYRGSSAAIVVYDITSERSFNEMQTWITELRQLGPQNLVLAIAGNKLDLESSRQVSTATGETFAKNANAIFMETSAKDGHNVQELFKEIAESLPLDKIALENKSSTLKLSRSSQKKENNCTC
ncbi:ras-related protein Rab-22A-like [Halichondria panicea]|uniref:ras-related protein Rab-22A-like n=1 Tax=Halichondria panicea TaxID=6063 RepID=UPI00312B8A14